jgi:hypothetical protein
VETSFFQGFAWLFVMVSLAAGCGDTRPTTIPPTMTPSPVPGPTSPPTKSAPGNGINGQFRGDLIFTEENTSYGWPARLTVMANLQQDGAKVTGDFNLIEVDYSGGFVRGTVDIGMSGDSFGTFIADFLPDDLGDHFAIDTKIVSPDSRGFEGTFVFAEGIVGRGNSTFTRVK